LEVNWRAISYYLNRVFYILGFSQLAPLTASLLLGENTYFSVAIALSSLATIAVGYFLGRVGTYAEITVTEAYVVVVVSFIVPSITCAVPLIARGIDPANALFEGVSSITTTGLSALPTGSLSPGVHFLRAFYQWLGGFSIALLVVSFFISPGSAAHSLYAAHLGRFKISPLSTATVRALLTLYVAFTGLVAVSYLASGMGFFDSVVNALTTTSTGGFSTYAVFTGSTLYVALVFMFVSAQPLAIYYLVLKGRAKSIARDPQFAMFSLSVLAGFAAVSLAIGHFSAKLLFQVVSALSTTGYTALDSSSLPEPAKLAFTAMMIMGACFGSTGGGLKQLRVYIVAKSIITWIHRQIAPSKAVIPVKIMGRALEDQEVMRVYTLTLMYIAVLLASAFIVSLYGYSVADSLFEAASALATTGLSVGISSPSLHLVPKAILAIDMLLGRLEIIPVAVVLAKLLKSR